MRVSFFALVFLFSFTAFAQRTEIDITSFIENLFQVQDEDLDYEGLYESLLIYYTNPINLNNTSPEELDGLYLLSPAQINHFFDHISENGPLISIYELQTIEGFDEPAIRSLLPFVTVEEKNDSRPLLQRIREERNHYLLVRQSGTVERQAGYKKSEENQYLGSPGTTYMRYRIQRYHDFSFGFTAEKDPGEQYWKNPGPDFFSAHASLENVGPVKKAILGDYQLQFGQGLVFGAGFSVGKGAETINSVKRSSTGLKPYASALESGFFRGVGTSFRFKGFTLTSFASSLRQDASLISDSTYSDFEEFANAIQATGFHRTPAELDARNQIQEYSFGGAGELKIGHRVNLGVTILQTNYSKPLQKKPNNYNQFEFQGSENAIGSLFGSASWQNLLFFGEVARSSSGGIGAVGGWIGSLSSMVDMSMVLRHYDRDFHSFYGNGFSEGTRLINEQGTYWGVKIRPSRKHELAAYYDRFSFPWLKYQTEAPSAGYEYLCRYTFKPNKTVKLYAQVRQENKQLTVTQEGANLGVLKTGVKRNYLFNVDYIFGPLNLKTRVQSSDYQLGGSGTHGLAIAQDLTYEWQRLKLSGRMALFDTDDFKNAQYLYEREVLYAVSVPALSGTGTRSYLLGEYRISKALTTWIRIARTSYNDVEAIGSGLAEIDGSKRTDYRVMLRIRL